MDTLFPHALSASQTLEALKTDATKGLSSQEAKLRLEQYGANQLTATKRVSPLLLFFHQF